MGQRLLHLLCNIEVIPTDHRPPKPTTMAPGQKLYPRATVKKIVKAHSKCNVSKNADVLIFLDYALFMQTLVKEAAIDSKQAGRPRQIQGMNRSSSICNDNHGHDREKLRLVNDRLGKNVSQAKAQNWLPGRFKNRLQATHDAAQAEDTLSSHSLGRRAQHGGQWHDTGLRQRISQHDALVA
ncbi:hypothetical protein JX266_003244 [Neoarthrinium moseri]|nr:hypothetical protein JX266_003244 [Neoarthrinium moseri]